MISSEREIIHEGHIRTARDLAECAAGYPHITRVYLFGSVYWNKDSKQSDIDIFVTHRARNHPKFETDFRTYLISNNFRLAEDHQLKSEKSGAIELLMMPEFYFDHMEKVIFPTFDLRAAYYCMQRNNILLYRCPDTTFFGRIREFIWKNQPGRV
jgi:predicted nucleotidyltransferase